MTTQKIVEPRAAKLPPRVLIVDDEADLRELLELTLVRMGLRTDLAGGVVEAKRLLAAHAYDLCLTDMRMQDGDGLELVRYLQSGGGDVPVAVITAYGSTDNAIAALKAGAFDYLAKPVGLDQLRTLVKSALRTPDPVGRARAGQERSLVGQSQAVSEVRDLIDRAARSTAPVHVSGESGSGKELAAQRLHALSGRGGAFIAVNCGAIPEHLMESEFFGYRKGAFTGADTDRDGFFQAAQGGTLFLDEVADLPVAMQVKLLRVIQEKKVRKVGNTVEEAVDVRIVSATHQKLAERVAGGLFRQDLFYRLNVIDVRMPSLRDCRDDIPDLARAILARLSEPGSRQSSLAPEALASLTAYDFPGNVRELENILERALALAPSEVIGVADLRLSPHAAELELPVTAVPGGGVLAHGGVLAGGSALSSNGGALANGMLLQDYLDQMERVAINEALERAGHNRTAAARLLGVTFRSLRYRLQRLGIEP